MSDEAKVATTSSCVQYCGQFLQLHATDSLLQFPHTKHPQFHSFHTAGLNYLLKQLPTFLLYIFLARMYRFHLFYFNTSLTFRKTHHLHKAVSSQARFIQYFINTQEILQQACH
jgi:hypothetical protein